MKTFKNLGIICCLFLCNISSYSQETMTNPIDLGNKASSFSYTDTKNTTNYANDYEGMETNDVFYKFTLTRVMDIIVSHCGSTLNDTYLSILDANGELLFDVDDNYDEDACSNKFQSFLKVPNLQPGTYYVVSEGFSDNGAITTNITGIRPTVFTNLYGGVDPSLDMNYIITVSPTIETSTATNLNPDNSIQTIQYFDKLGFPAEIVQRGFTPQKKDLVSFMEFDGVGHETVQWLPIPSEGAGEFISKSTFSANTYYNDSLAFNENMYELSTRNRLTNKYGPGADWAGKSVRTIVGSNTSDIEYFYINGSEQLVRGANYDAGTLVKTTTFDEDNKSTTEYIDRVGRLVMKQNGTDVRTYFVYNEQNQLAYVLPPKVYDALKSFALNSPIPDSNDNLKKYGYLYKYDERGNCVAKRLPGCGWIYMIYDRAYRMVLSQAGNQRKRTQNGNMQWTATRYDNYGRVVTTGLTYLANTDSAANYNTLQEVFDDQLVLSAYTTNGFNACTPLTENYYDNYGFINSSNSSALSFTSNSGYGAKDESVNGLQTGSKIYLLDGSGAFTISATYYDSRTRVVQTRSTNHLGGVDVASNSYDFNGNVLSILKEHNSVYQSTVTEKYSNTYDHAGRLLTTTYRINTKDPVLLVNNTYDPLGRLTGKTRHNNAEIGGYDYNIRNQQTSIRSGNFEEKLYYNKNLPTNATPCYNGNIAYSTWTYNSATNSYMYGYDNLNRLTYADCRINGIDTYSYNEIFNYDKMGNIDYLERQGQGQTIDYLNFTYNGNQITAIMDDFTSQDSYSIKEYQDKAGYSSNEMAYDGNGNLIKDLDRDIVTIRYNLLNLPELIQFKNGNQIRNLYDASGRKLQTRNYTLTDETVVPVAATFNVDDLTNLSWEVIASGTDYVGNMLYEYYADYYDGEQGSESNYLYRILNPEGYTLQLSNPQYYYYRRDHLGNNREVWRANDNTVQQRTQYYPSGLPWAYQTGDKPGTQPYKYNGKEWVEMHGLDVSDLGWRSIHNSKFRFDTFDPDAELDYDISPYAACHNNPVLKVDPNGRWVETAWDVFSLATGAASFVDNVRQGNVGAAILDGVGVVADAAAVVIPLVPGGVGAGIKALRVGDKILETTKVIDKINDTKKVTNILENAKNGKTFEKKVGETLKGAKAEQLTIEAADGTRVKLDFGQNNGGKVTLTEAKGSANASFTKNQKKGIPQIEKSGGIIRGKKGQDIGLPAGTRIPPTNINVIRPDDLIK